jgi:hypothetical protein
MYRGSQLRYAHHDALREDEQGLVWGGWTAKPLNAR